MSCPYNPSSSASSSSPSSSNSASATLTVLSKSEFNDDDSAMRVGCPVAGDSKNPMKPKKGFEPVYYGEYLELPQLLSLQNPRSMSPTTGSFAHEEMLFIITHQTYELWFKQILHDIHSIRQMLNVSFLPEEMLGTAIRRLTRITKIQRILIDQLDILETMTPLDFLDFRDYLFPASGFQSLQFRLVENSLGLARERRLKYARSDYDSHMDESDKKIVHESETAGSLFDLVQRWLERTPFLESQDYDFWTSYQNAVKTMFAEDRQSLENADLSPEEMQIRLASIAQNESEFTAIFEPEEYAKLLQTGIKRLSLRATKAAILINLYRDEPIFQLPFQLLTILVDIDDLMTSWRYRHASMVRRMLGLKLGTGGSSGYHYLKATATHHKVFEDFANLAMFLIPRSQRPQLPSHIKARLRFHYDPVNFAVDK